MRSPLSALRASLIPTARLRRGGGGKSGARGTLAVVSQDGAALTLRGMRSGAHAAVRRLGKGGAPIDELNAIAYEQDGIEGASAWQYALRALERAGLVQYTVTSEVGSLARLTPMSPYYDVDFNAVAAGERLALSRFALARRASTGRGWILESPLALARIELLHPRSMVWLHALGAPVTLATLARSAPLRERAPQHAFIALLFAAGFLQSARGTPANADDGEAHLATWEFADALVHARSRRGRHDQPYGRVFPFRGSQRPSPLIKAAMSSDSTPLARPNLAALSRDDRPFSRVLEARRSLRAHGRRPIDVRQLGEFLYRAARVQATLKPDARVRPYDASLRPSPSGGACHELELYLVVNRCAGLARGVYHYDPMGHRLERLATGEERFQALLDDCPAPENAPLPWHILIIISARFQRVSWKYRGMSYATILKDVGALMQTMYLVATAMRLAPCALGGGDSERFARAIGSDFFEETSVGEFLMGTRAGAQSSVATQ